MVEQCFDKALVESSILSLGTKYAAFSVMEAHESVKLVETDRIRNDCPSNACLAQLVEHLVANQKVAGSNPVARTTYNNKNKRS